MSAARKRVTRGRPSRIDGLPPEIKATVDQLLRSGVPQNDIIERLKQPLEQIGEPPLSRSGINRYATRMEAVGAGIREINAIAEAWTAKLGEEPTGNVAELTIQVLRSLAFRATMRAHDKEDEEDEGLDIETIGELALAVQRLERSGAMTLERERKLREAAAARAAEAAKGALREAGVSDDAVDKMLAAIRGTA